MRTRTCAALSVSLALAALPARADIVVGAGPGGGSVHVYDSLAPNLIRNFAPYGGGYTGGVRVAVGDVTGDGRADYITGADSISTHIKVFDGVSGVEVRSFFAFDGLATGVRVAAGDVNGDGRADIIATPGPGFLGAHIKVFSGLNNDLIASFLSFPGVDEPITVAAGDVNGDGRADIVAGAAANGHIKVFSGANTAIQLQSFLAFGGFVGPLAVAAGDLDLDGRADLVGAVGPSGHLKSFDGESLAPYASFFTFPAFNGTLDAAAADLNGDGVADYVVGASQNSHVKVFSGADPNITLASFFAFPGFTGAAYVAAIPAPGPVALLAAPFVAALLRRRRR